MVIDTLLLSATAPGSGGAAATVASPGSLTLQPDATVQIGAVTVMFQSLNGRLVLISPSGHDTSSGYSTIGGSTSVIESMTRTGPFPRLSRGETITATIYGSAAAGDVELAAISLVYDLPGADTIEAAQLPSRIENVTTAYVSSITPTTNGTWPAGIALSSMHTQLRPQRKYAVLGFEVGSSNTILGASIIGPDTGWYRQLWPVAAASRGSVTPSDYVRRIAAESPALALPVITGGNAPQTMIGLVGNENATSRHVAIQLALLK